MIFYLALYRDKKESEYFLEVGPLSIYSINYRSDDLCAAFYLVY